MKRNDRLPELLSSEHLGAENIRGHQVRRELDALGVEPERDAERFDQLGLGEAGNPDQQRMTAGQDRHQGVFDHPFLAEDDGGDRFLCGAIWPATCSAERTIASSSFSTPSALSHVCLPRPLHDTADCVVMPRTSC